MPAGGFIGDLRFALRQLAARPGFTVAAVLTLALGIGANTAVFSMLNGYLLKPLPYPHGGRLVSVSIRLPKFYRNDEVSVSIPMYERIRKDVTALSGMVAARYDPFSLRAKGRGTYVAGIAITGDMVRTLGIEPLLGRALTAADDRPERSHVAVISDRLWKNEFGGKRDVVGRPIRLNGSSYTVVGVMPRGFAFSNGHTDIWVPNAIDPAEKAARNPFDSWLGLFVGRLNPGATLRTLDTQLAYVRKQTLDGLPPDLERKYGDSGFRFVAQSYRGYELADESGPEGNRDVLTLLLLQAAVLLVLLLTCVNVANLLLARILGRGHEMAMRRTLGATRRALVRQLLTEGLCLAVPGGLAGLALGWLCVRLIAGSPLNPTVSLFDIAVDWRVGLFVFAAVCLVGVLVSALPAMHLSTADLKCLLQDGGRATGGGRGAKRARNTLAVVQIALATALLAGAGLLLHSFVNLQGVSTGFVPDHLMAMRLLGTGKENSPQGTGLRRDILRRVQNLPGVRYAAMASWVPLEDYFGSTAFRLAGRKPFAAPRPMLDYDAVTPQFFATLGMPIVRGRGFGAADTKGGKLVAVVDARFARRFFADGEAVGQEIDLYGQSHDEWVRIVGVTRPIKLQSLDRAPPYEIYLDDAQLRYTYGQGMRLLVRTRIAPSRMAASIRKTVARIAPDIAVYGGYVHVYGMRGIIGRRLQYRRTFLFVALAFGAMALALAVIGLYGVLNYAVAQRRNEFGVRLALGATPASLRTLVLGDALKLFGIGVAAGLISAVIAGHFLGPLLFHVRAYDPATLAATVLALGLTAFVACYLPARRAGRLHPTDVICKP